MKILPRKKSAARTIAPADTEASSHSWMHYNLIHRNTLLQNLGLFVGLPTLIAAIYFLFIAADQYQAEAHFLLRSPQQAAAPAGLNALIGGMGGMSQSSQDARSVAEYIQSHDAVASLAEVAQLRDILANPKADFVARMPADAALEDMLKYYKNQVDVLFNTDTGTVNVLVRAYTPDDARKLAEAIVHLSEETVNNLNQRAEEDALDLARRELARAEARVAEVRADMAAFRVDSKDIDPASKSGSILATITQLEEERNQTQVQLRELQAYAVEGNPQLRALQRRVNALQQQIKQEQARLTGMGDTYTHKLSAYEQLTMEQELAQQAYASALVSLENARLEAQRQKSYVTPIIRPQTPQSAEYPERFRGIALVFFTALLAFGLGRLVVASVRDHVMH